MANQTVKIWIFKQIQKSSILYGESSLNPNITFIDEKLWPVAWNQRITSVIQSSVPSYENKNNKNTNTNTNNNENNNNSKITT